MTNGIVKSYGTVYKKYVNVTQGEKESITMYTPGTGKTASAYYLLVQRLD